jgi:hypothetical protein
VIVCDPPPTALGAYVTEHVAVPPPPESVQLLAGVKFPLALVPKVTVPEGVLVPAPAVTVAVQDVVEPYVTGFVAQLTVVVDVGRV